MRGKKSHSTSNLNPPPPNVAPPPSAACEERNLFIQPRTSNLEPQSLPPDRRDTSPARLFHVPHPLCTSGRKPRPMVVSPPPTPQPALFHIHPSTACFSPFFLPAGSAISFGFLSKRLRKKRSEIRRECLMKIMCKSCGKNVENLRIRSAFPCANAVDNLR